MSIEDMKFSDVMTVARALGGTSAAAVEPTAKIDRGFSIVILDRGWVIVGNVVQHGDWLITTDAQNIRAWGTTRGLGEIAKGGPTSNTKLDPMGVVRSPLRAVIGVIECEASAWKR